MAVEKVAGMKRMCCPHGLRNDVRGRTSKNKPWNLLKNPWAFQENLLFYGLWLFPSPPWKKTFSYEDLGTHKKGNVEKLRVSSIHFTSS